MSRTRPGPGRQGDAVAHAARPAVLAVDDDREILGYFEDALGDDFDVLTATNGAAALDLVRGRRIDVVLLDIVLPGMDGLQVLRRLRMSDSPPEVIVLSGLDNTRVAVNAVQYGAAEYVTKPFDGAELRTMILGACERRRHPTRAAVVPSPLAGTKGAVLMVGADIGGLAPVPIALAGQVVTRLASSAHPALAFFAELTPGLVVIETTLPHIEWVGLLRTLRVSARRCPVLMMATTTATNDLEVGTAGPDISVIRPGDLHELLERIASLHGGGAGPLRLPRYRPSVLRAIQFMARHHAGSLATAGIARVSGLSARQLADVFRADTGLTVMEYLTQVRVEVARCLVAEAHGRLEEVAARAGFSDASHLSRVFLREVGQRPGQYRQRLTFGNTRRASADRRR